MQKNNRIAVIGGTGKSGQYLVKSLMEKGMHFKLLIRNPKKLISANEYAAPVFGHVQDLDAIRNLLQGCNTVISCLGSGIPQSEPTIFSEATQNILRVMQELGINRYIVLTGLNVNTPLDQKGMATKASTAWMYENFPVATKNRQEEYAILAKSDVDWTLVRLPLIALTEEHTALETNTKDCEGSQISAASLADFLIRQIADTSFVKKAPFVYNK